MEFLPVLRYLALCLVLTALGAPIAAWLFARIPGKGAAFALPTALVPFAIVVFWLGQVTFGYHTLVAGLIVLLIGATVARRRGFEPDWRRVLSMYGVFTLGFLVLVAFRASNPSISPAGGEQFLHYGMLNALERATVLPPEDLWYAGEPLKYYYGTQLQVASLAMLSGTEMRYGFNLGIATFYGVLVVTAYGLASSIAARQNYSERLCGGLGVIFAAFGGGTTTATRLLAPSLPEPIAGPVKEGAFGFVAQRFYGGDLQKTVSEVSAYDEWGWWFTRYVVPGTIQETPLYSFVKGDLHGHALSTGLVLFAGAIAFAYYVTPAAERRRRAALVFGGLGAIAGVFGFMNTWALPTAGGVTVLALGAANAHPATLLPDRYASTLQPTSGATPGTVRRIAAETWRLVLAALAGGIVVGIGIAVASPFLVFGDIPTNNGIGVFPPRSHWGPFLVIYGGLLALFATFVLARSSEVLTGVKRSRLVGATVGLALLVVVQTTVVDFAVLALTAPLVVGAWLLVRTERGGFAMILLVAGVGLVLSLELVHAKIPAIDPPRWNTALKVAVQGWTLAATGAGVAAGMLLSDARDRLNAFLEARRGSAVPTADADSTAANGGAVESPPTRGRAVAWAVALAVVVASIASAMAFPMMTFGTEIGNDVYHDEWNPTIDGHDALDTFRPKEAAAFAWLDDRPGTPTIVEAPGDSYTWTSPASVFTGLPAVIGWDHQEEYRSPAAYDRRVRAVDSIYRGQWASAAANLSRYDVTYVVVGPAERDRYGPTLRSFDRDAFTVVFENDAVTIYAVNHDRLRENRSSITRPPDPNASLVAADRTGPDDGQSTHERAEPVHDATPLSQSTTRPS